MHSATTVGKVAIQLRTATTERSPPKPLFRPLRYPDTKARGPSGSALFVSLCYNSPDVRKANEGFCQVCWRMRRWHNGRTRRSLNRNRKKSLEAE